MKCLLEGAAYKSKLRRKIVLTVKGGKVTFTVKKNKKYIFRDISTELNGADILVKGQTRNVKGGQGVYDLKATWAKTVLPSKVNLANLNVP